MMKAVSTYETSDSVCETTWRNNPEDCFITVAVRTWYLTNKLPKLRDTLISNNEPQYQTASLHTIDLEPFSEPPHSSLLRHTASVLSLSVQ